MRLVAALVIAASIATIARADTRDRDALAFWHRLAPTWSTWRHQRKTIPHARERELGRAILRGGNFACPLSKPTPLTCKRSFPIREPAATAGFDDPCMRHVLLTWALRMLSEDELAEMRDDLVPVVAAMTPGDELAREIIERVSLVGDDAVVPLLVAIGNTRSVDPAWFESEVDRAPPSAWPALRAAHLYRSTPFERTVDETPWILEQANDPLVDAQGRVWAMRTLVEMLPPTPMTVAAIAKLASDPDCGVAMPAAVLVAQTGNTSYLPRRPTTADPIANARAICMASQDVSYLDHGAIAASARQVLDRYRAGSLPPLSRCDATHCLAAESTVELHFAPAPDGGVILDHASVAAVQCPEFERSVDDYDFDLDDALEHR